MAALKSHLVGIRSRILELAYRFAHASKVFSRRFFTLAIPGHVQLDESFVFEVPRAKDRGAKAPDGKYYSKYYNLQWKELPVGIKDAIRKYDSVIRMYLGDDYLINDGLIWRNMSIPPEFKGNELFSQHWHYDKVVDFRNIQLFVLLHDTTEDDGPFEYVVEPDEHNLMPSVLKRTNMDVGVKTAKLTGKRGDCFLFSTGSTPHRAGVPAEGRHRDIFSIAFFPAYTKIGTSSKALLSQS
ncbi:hypothetical protein ASE04_13860 [Rhizobium sp. Root708]|uniref:hypothetical protein n=1 Tax=Rhizobium sp. Root708 TaxID=1736592 RepID=UPI0006F4135C|nr:hypothetical protein [Rhizobium sp. Root708]KRB50993.1 hypothetical protein ASE04_13860 [Rhizobium sp. Root708]